MSSWRQQALIEAPVEEVWKLVADPRAYPSYASNVVEVTGVPKEIERDATFRQVMKTPFGTGESTFKVEELDELHEIKMRCTSTGYYSRWLLTEARENTFVDLEIGIEAENLRYRTLDATVGKRWYRRMADEALDGLKRVLARK